MRDRQSILKNFEKAYGESRDVRVFFSPGRVNLIGEHTDYNGGHVFPCALTMGTYAAARRRRDRKLRFFSVNFAKLGIMESSLDDLTPQKEAGWTNYPKGILWALQKRGFKIPCGLDLMIECDIPNGSGLSSSASIEIAVGCVVNALFGFGLSKRELALLGQYSENQFNGVKCGIMDQFAVAMGKRDCAIFLNTADLTYEYAPIRLSGLQILISCSNKRRGLSSSKYNERRQECERALFDLQRNMEIETLCELDEPTFEYVKLAIRSEVCRRRAGHVVYENRRVIRAVQALKEKDTAQFGQLMNASHISLRDEFEVTGKELDTLVEEAWRIDGVIGSRMTGAGFGGCTVSIVKKDAVPTFIDRVGEAYRKKIGYPATFYKVRVGGGPCELQ